MPKGGREPIRELDVVGAGANEAVATLILGGPTIAFGITVEIGAMDIGDWCRDVDEEC